MTLDHATLEQALQTLGEILAARGEQHDLAVVDGGALLILGLIWSSSWCWVSSNSSGTRPLRLQSVASRPASSGSGWSSHARFSIWRRHLLPGVCQTPGTKS